MIEIHLRLRYNLKPVCLLIFITSKNNFINMFFRIGLPIETSSPEKIDPANTKRIGGNVMATLAGGGLG